MAKPFDCAKCPAYCCSYEQINVNKRDIHRLGKHFDLDPETVVRRFTKMKEGIRVLRHQKDKIYGSVCIFLDIKTRRCTIYESRPEVCRTYPDHPRCGYYDFLQWERRQQGDDDFIPFKHG